MQRTADIFLNLFVPLGLGVLLYLLPLPALLRNYVPDALWAYACTSAILLIWDRSPHRGWLLFLFLSFVLFEALQKTGLVAGTADPGDVLAYFLAAGLALFLNPYFQFKTNNTQL
ncbi:MAG: hypothetical protein IBJ09_13150 [Bacteroidia bacterium]|nr:hypothetical protein [Bacteroidia bacterium]